MSNPTLTVTNLNKAFGGLVVANNINFTVNENEVRCIIGPNGAGKTTFFNLLTGLITPDSGSIKIDSTEITSLPTFKRQKLGLARTFQTPRIFPELTVLENVALAVNSDENIFSLITNLQTKKELIDEIDHALEKVNLINEKNKEAGALSHGEKKRVEMAMSIIQKPKVFFMDEPTAGMTIRETKEIAEFVQSIKDEMSVVVVEHDMEFVKEIADQVTVLYRGELVREGTIEELEKDPFIQEIYLGSAEI